MTTGDDSALDESPRPQSRLPSFARSAVTFAESVTTKMRPWS